MKRSIKLYKMILPLLLCLCPLLLTGCGDLVEIQERDFVMALGVSFQDGQYQVTYGLPDLGVVTEQSTSADKSSLTRTYTGKSLFEIDQMYNFHSESRLDYRHLQVIILDTAICGNAEAMRQLLTQINDNYDISHNVLVYYYDSDVTELMLMDGVNGSIGEHLKKLNNNNHINGMEPSKIGSLVDCIYNQRTLFIPSLTYRDDSVAVEGGILYSENRMLKKLSQPEGEIYYITMGKSNDYLLRPSENELIQLKNIASKIKYEQTKQGPLVKLTITGTAKSLPESIGRHDIPAQSVNAYVRDLIIGQWEMLAKRDSIDYLNLYEKSSYKSRPIWIQYQNRPEEFIRDVGIDVVVDIHFE